MSYTVHTRYGSLQGMEDGGVAVFRGIPFARPPVGPLRFRPPERPEPWSGVRDATRFGPAALQAESPAAQVLGIILDKTDEDCLYLNVWTPAADGQRRPVMVWIHGGAFVIGAGSQALYNGAALARRGDVVVVTINYRLGLFGFLRGREFTGGALDSTGNEGMLDQVAALEWVRDEIAAFGGDPDNVTVFGESAGSISVAALLTMPRAQGLFHKAIMQSGSLNLLNSVETAGTAMKLVLEDLGIAPKHAARLRDLPAEQLLVTQNRATPRVGGVPYAPIADGEVIPAAPYAAIADGAARGIPLLAGTNLDEMKLFRYLDPTVDSTDEAGLIERCRALAPAMDAERLVETYRTARAARGDSVTPPELWFAISTDQVFRTGAMRLLELQGRHTPRTFAYLFTWKSPAFGGVFGAAHALDLPFVFGTLDDPGLGRMIGGDRSAAALSARVQDAWLAFARSGSPATESLPAWEPYAPPRRATMLLNETVELQGAPLEAERAVWDAI